MKFSLSLAESVAEVASSRVVRRVVARGSRDTGPRHNISYSFISLKVANCKGYRYLRILNTSASKSSIQRFVITEKALTRAFSWLKVATTTFTLTTLLRHNAKRALTPW